MKQPSVIRSGLSLAAALAAFATAAGLVPAVTSAAPSSPDMASKLAGKTIFLDPGHQGPNHTENLDRPVGDGRGGTKACQTTGMTTVNGVPEHTINWNVSQLVKQSLEALGARVVLSRHDDTGWGGCIDERAAAANRSGADLAVSIHADGAPAQARGFHLIVPQLPIPDAAADRAQSGAGLAATKVMRDAYRQAGFQAADYGGTVDGLQTRADVAGPALTQVPDVFLEMGNGANSEDAKLLESPDGQLKHAITITTGLVSYLLNIPLPGTPAPTGSADGRAAAPQPPAVPANSLPGPQPDALPGTQVNGAPAAQANPAPGAHPNPVPGAQVEAVPGAQANSVPGSQVEAVPETQANSVPGAQAGAVPGAQVNGVPGSQTSAVPGAQTNTAPGAQPNAVPGTATGVPGAQANSVPGSQVEAVPGAQVNSVPEAQASGVPGSQSNTVPGAQTNALPGAQANAVPGAQAGAVPGTQADGVPGSQVNVVPGSQAGAVPGAPTSAVPGAQAGSGPGTQANSVPGAQVEAVPGVSAQGTNGQVVPMGPQGAVPASPGAVPSASATPDSSIPADPRDWARTSPDGSPGIGTLPQPNGTAPGYVVPAPGGTPGAYSQNQPGATGPGTSPLPGTQTQPGAGGQPDTAAAVGTLATTAMRMLLPLAKSLGLGDDVVNSELINLAYNLVATLISPWVK
ncbi:N-acetylmuramoyl-L-alanine amidase [Nocardia transvalensis]|uniref:N-acetylmuramoyl-L-alanine amidase n=1 Tax=Nocardia transvalensis TaxID=37333 RepID=UPI0018936DFF|nr:N-acetylmuramoyl-L-alanine amidase [Nocardia transvalensis]